MIDAVGFGQRADFATKSLSHKEIQISRINAMVLMAKKYS